MLQSFGALPTEARVKDLCERDYLWCALHLLLDEEERLAALCPTCRERAVREPCPVCGVEIAACSTEVNEGFDWTRFAKLKEGGEVLA